jgi:hypothetical protein
MPAKMERSKEKIVSFPIYKARAERVDVEPTFEVVNLAEYKSGRNYEKLLNERSPQGAALREHLAFMDKGLNR